FQFEPREASRALRAAANRALREGLDARVGELVEAPDDAFSLTAEGAVLWREAPVGRLLPGDRPLAPQVEAIASDLLDPPRRERVRRRLAGWLANHLRRTLGPLLAALEAPLAPAPRGLVYSLAESLGSAPRRRLRAGIEALTRADRQELARQGMALGWRHVFQRALLAPEALRVRATLWHVRHPEPAVLPVGPASLRAAGAPDPRRDAACGYESVAGLLLRVDALEEALTLAHHGARRGQPPPVAKLARLLHCDAGAVPGVLAALGLGAKG
ncbi:MAG: disulfide oxidoreductase, partial [Vicinamibacteria bacterium]|nr:disulfide oxidoreductase [Vicinamibacteria bacterium]